ncbi:MAG: SurA N-terminal domain-containing protein [Desulfobacterales bacterium]|jgi:peptidyl-prolyl cis-trans isomerase SurA|nr:SurA N-terminal domain-containing protein [Desulfobacterales bacterium]
MLNRLAIIFFSFLLFFLCAALSYGGDYVDRVVAVVNDDVILQTELEKAGGEYFERIRMKAPAGEVESAIEKARGEVLSSLIDNMIVKQKAAELGLTVEEAEIDNAIAQILSDNNATLEEFRKELDKVNVSMQDYRDNLRNQILQSRLVGQQVRSRIVIVEEDIKEYYEKEYTQEKGESGYYILQIGFNWKNLVTLDGVSQEEAREKAEAIRARVLAGESFGELARSYSDFPSATDGGNLGLIKKDEMAAYMRDAILSMHPGDISPIIETGSTFQFFKLLSSREGDLVVKAPYESVKDEIREILYRQEMEKDYKAWVENLREQAYIKILL